MILRPTRSTRTDTPYSYSTLCRSIWHLFRARPGGGGSSGGEGCHNAGEWHSAGGLRFGSVEVAEARFPLFFGRHEFRPDSGGDGRFVGGTGCDLSLTVDRKSTRLNSSH